MLVLTGEGLSDEDRRAITAIADSAENEVRRLLPQLEPELTLEVVVGTWVIEETGELGTALAPGIVRWMVDPGSPGGVTGLTERRLRATLFHELHHQARGWLVKGATHPWPRFVDAAVCEGLATAFARDAGGDHAPWTELPNNIDEWVTDVLEVADYASYGEWMFSHADGRRWIGYRAGTRIADLAIAASGLTAADLVTTPTEDILRLAGLSSS